MNSPVPVLVKVGHIPEASLLDESLAITDLWGAKLIRLSCKDSPIKTLNAFSEDNCLIHLSGLIDIAGRS
mgnify:CR=1 FL=1